MGVALILVVIGGWQLKSRPAEPAKSFPPSFVTEPPTATFDTPPPSLEVKAVSTNQTTPPPARISYAVVPGDTIVSWDFVGAYTNNPELIAKAENEIKRLSDLLLTATSSAMIVSIGIANQYELIGDGKKQYDYLGRAIQASPENGLPWHNLGVLMERLGAFKTARSAYEEATLVHPQLSVYHYTYLSFLIRHMRNDTAGIEKAFVAAEKNIGKAPDLVDLRAEWTAP